MCPREVSTTYPATLLLWVKNVDRSNQQICTALLLHVGIHVAEFVQTKSARADLGQCRNNKNFSFSVLDFFTVKQRNFEV
eukprot:4368078-Amphidinium_carterae.1